MNSSEQEFYAHLGLLSIQFAKMEYKLSVIVGKLIGTDDETIELTLMGDNSLHQNIEYLRKLNRIRSFQEEEIQNLIIKVNEVKAKRNLFIHGIWGEPYKKENEVYIHCDEKKLRYQKDGTLFGKKFEGKSWMYNQIYKFTLSEIKEIMSKIDGIIEIEDNILLAIDELDFF